MVIELGTDWAAPASAPPWRPGPRSRLLAGVVAVLLVTSVLAGSAEPAPQWRLVASVPANFGDYVLLSGELIVARPRGTALSVTGFDAYDLPGGRRLWHTTLPARLSLLSADSPDVVLAELDSGSETQRGDLAALDIGTGRVLWRAARTSISDYPGPADRNAVLVTATGGAATVGAADELRLVDTRSGRAIWSQPLPTGVTAAVPAPGLLVLWSVTGLTRVLDERTGQPLATGQLAADPSVPPGTGPSLSAAGGLLLHLNPLPTGTAITAYDLATLALRWRLNLGDQVRFATDCATLICVDGDHGLTALDPGSGERRWSSDQWQLAGTAGARSVVTGVRPDPANRHTLVDLTTGRVVLDLGGWEPLDTIEPGRPTVLVADQRVGRPGAWVARLSSDQTRVAPEAFLPDARAGNCTLGRSARTYLACVTVGGPVHVWMDRPLPR